MNINTESIFIKAYALFSLYKWLLLPAIPALILIIFIFSLLSAPQTRPASTVTSTTPPPTQSQAQQVAPTGKELPNTTGLQAQTISEGNEEDDPTTIRGFQKEETQSDGTHVYFYTSGNPNRPNLKIVSPDGSQTLFSRTLASPSFPLSSVSVYEDAYGKPDQIIQGTSFYGRVASIHIYATIGLAIIANDQTGTVYEEQLFPAMSAQDYRDRFGNQN